MQPALYGNIDEVYHVISKYKCTPRYIQLIGSIYKVFTDQGVYALKCTHIPLARLERVHQLLKDIREEGYPHLLPTVVNAEGKMITEHKIGNWYMMPWQSSLSPDGDKSAKGVDIARALARFHRLASKLVSSNDEFLCNSETLLFQSWKEQQPNWKKEQQYWLKNKYCDQTSDLWNDYSEKMDQAFSFSLRGMEKFISIEKGKAPRYTLCHCRIHSSNIVKGEAAFYLLDFDDSGICSPIRDLAVLMRRYTPDKEGGADPKHILEAYEEEWRLRPKEKKILAIHLAYPERIMKRLRKCAPAVYTDNENVPVTYRTLANIKPLTSQEMIPLWKAELCHLEQLQGIVRSLWSVRSRSTISPGMRRS